MGGTNDVYRGRKCRAWEGSGILGSVGAAIGRLLLVGGSDRTQRLTAGRPAEKHGLWQTQSDKGRVVGWRCEVGKRLLTHTLKQGGFGERDEKGLR